MTISDKKRSSINRANGRRQSQGFWTESRVALLRMRWKPGANVFDIASEIGNGCTRNMVIGKAYRLGLPTLPINESRKSERTSEALKAQWQDPVLIIRRVTAIERAVKKHWSDPAKAKAHADAISRGRRNWLAARAQAAE